MSTGEWNPGDKNAYFLMYEPSTFPRLENFCTCRIARRAGLFARFKEQFSQMLQGITENRMHIVVTISYRIFFTILHDKKSCTANTV